MEDNRFMWKFKRMNALEFARYHLENPECLYAHEYMTRIANIGRTRQILQLLEQINPIQNYSDDLDGKKYCLIPEN